VDELGVKYGMAEEVFEEGQGPYRISDDDDDDDDIEIKKNMNGSTR
jgi:hypothetical protein